jgi:hypothetical protein
MKKRMRRRAPVFFCSGEHQWGDFIPYKHSDLVKRCLHCTALLTKKEFLSMMIKPVVIIRKTVEVKTGHIDLFWS